MCKHLAKDNHSLDDDGPCIPYLATHKQSVDERDKSRHGSQTEMQFDNTTDATNTSAG
jgi:hypothetical protein